MVVSFNPQTSNPTHSPQHFSLRVNRIRSARGASAIQSEAVDLELERLRREERAILQRKRQEELDRTRGPVPHWSALLSCRGWPWARCFALGARGDVYRCGV